MKKIICLFVCSVISTLCINLSASAQENTCVFLGEWNVLSYDLSSIENTCVYEIYEFNFTTNTMEKVYKNEFGYRLEEYQVTGDDFIYYREIPFDKDNKLYTIDGERVLAKKIQVEGLDWEWIFTTIDGKEVTYTNVWFCDIIDSKNGFYNSYFHIIDTPKYMHYDIVNHWSKDYVLLVTQKELIDDIEPRMFYPDDPMTREMFVTALARLSGIEDNYVDWAINIGLLQGYGNGEYGLDDTITREQMAVFFERYMTLAKIDIASLKTVANTTFADDSSIADWSKSSVYTMQAMKLIQGKNNNIFDPQGLTTRAEAATVLYNLITVTGK